MKLTSKEKAFLKGKANHLKPLFQVGKNGLSQEQIKQIDDALESHELMKISLLQNAFESPKEVADAIAEATDAVVIQVIGRVIVLFKKSSKEKNRKVSLELNDL